MWHVVPYFYIHISVHRFSSSSRCVPLPLLDLLFSLVRVCLMPLSMLIVRCSKAAFIKMIKHSQTTAKYLKASGRGTWQVTTSHTNSSTSIHLTLPRVPVERCHIPCLVGHRLLPYVTRASNEKLSADEGGWLHKKRDPLPPTRVHAFPANTSWSQHTDGHCAACVWV